MVAIAASIDLDNLIVVTGYYNINFRNHIIALAENTARIFNCMGEEWPS